VNPNKEKKREKNFTLTLFSSLLFDIKEKKKDFFELWIGFGIFMNGAIFVWVIFRDWI
jgi:hypothetical protein